MSTMHVHAVAEPLGVTVDGNISTHTASPAVLEGGIASKMQVVQEVHDAKSKLCI